MIMYTTTSGMDGALEKIQLFKVLVFFNLYMSLLLFYDIITTAFDDVMITSFILYDVCNYDVMFPNSRDKLLYMWRGEQS